MAVPDDSAAMRRTEELVTRARAELAWLRDDGYVESDANVIPGRFHLTFRGPHGQIVVSVHPGMSEIEIWLRPKGMSGYGWEMQEYLKARGLVAPHPRIDATSREAVERALDSHLNALKLLRDTELAGNWAAVDREGIADARRQREKIIDQIVRRAKAEPPER
jgi:hypothetical protein